MSMIGDFRESKTFKFIADVSVVHWLMTITPGIVSGLAATMHGRSLEVVILYFFGVSALVLVVLHYGGLAWAKFRNQIITESVDRIPAWRSLWRLGIPVLSFAVLLFGSWIIHSKHRPAINTPTVSSNSGIPAAPAQQISPSKNNKELRKSSTPKKAQQSQPPLQQSTPAPLPPPAHVDSAIVENTGRVDGLVILNSTATAPPNGSARILDNSGQASDVMVQGSQTSTASATTPLSSEPYVYTAFSSDILIENQVICGLRTELKTDDSNSHIEVVNSSLNDPHICNWFPFLESARKNRLNIVPFLNNWKDHMVLAPPESAEQFERDWESFVKKLSDASQDERTFNSTIGGLEMHPPTFDVTKP